MANSMRYVLTALFILVSFSSSFSYGQQSPEPASENIPVEEIAVEPTFEEQLIELHDTLKAKEKEKKDIEQKLKANDDALIAEQLQQELNAADDIIVGLREQIVSLSTGGAKLYDEPPVVNEEFDWQKDLELIFEPLLDQLREISERPRLIEQLEADISYWQKRKTELAAAITNIQENRDQVERNSSKRELQALLETAESRHKSAAQKLALLDSQLAELKQANNPIWGTLGDILSAVVIGVVLNFLLAFGAAFLAYQLVRLISLIPIYFVTKNKPDGSVFAERAIIIGRTIVGVMLAVIVYFVMLYSFAEWLLLVLSVLVIVGFVLGLKDALPAYFLEIKTLLNMGTIRQGERLIFEGLPWRISRLNVHTHLHNPALHGHLRVPLASIANLSSRPYHDNEPWFPCKVGDIVFLEDDTFGRIIRQSPDMVEVDLGQSIYSYQTTDFLTRRPRNLSREGFTIYEIFGFDYQHQADITQDILAKYKKDIVAAVESSPFREHSSGIEVEFNNASASSLDFKILASFGGEAAADYFKIKRFLQAASVDIANRYGWIIPFQQITVHYNSEPENT